MSVTSKILVVDDDPYILMSLEFLMRKSGFEVMIARNGTEALQLLDTHNPDVVLLDIMMPDVDGYSICEFIKSTEKHKQCKVVFLSAKSKEADIQKGYDLGADLYITKPFANKDLVNKIKSMIPQN